MFALSDASMPTDEHHAWEMLGQRGDCRSKIFKACRIDCLNFNAVTVAVAAMELRCLGRRQW